MLKTIFGRFIKKEQNEMKKTVPLGGRMRGQVPEDPLYSNLLWNIDQGMMKTPDGHYKRVFFVNRGDISFLYDEKTGEKISQTGPIMLDVFSDIGQLREAYRGEAETILSNIPPAFRISLDPSGKPVLQTDPSARKGA